MAELTYRDAVARGIAQEMTRDPDVVFLGEDVIIGIEKDVRRVVDEATEKCKAAPMPPADILCTDVYADGGFAWRN